MSEHDWNHGEGDTCTKCGDKDWMADPVCSESKLRPDVDQNAKLREAVRAHLNAIEHGSVEDEQDTADALEALIQEGNDVGVEEQFQAGLRDVERNLREDK